MLSYFPKYFARKSLTCYLLSLAVVTVLFFKQAMPVYLYVFGIVSVIAFFYGTSTVTRQWARYSPRVYEKKVLSLALTLRLVYVLFIYCWNYHLYGTFCESNPADIDWYIYAGQELAHYIRIGDWSVFSVYIEKLGVAFDDMGYITYLSFLYMLTGGVSSVVIPLILKAVMGAYTCVFAYRIATRHFGYDVGRLTGVFCALQFNMIWWCGSMMKETEMVFFAMAFFNILDGMVEEGKVNAKRVVSACFIGIFLFSFRMVLGAVCIASMMLAIVFASKRKIGSSTKVLTVLMVAVLLGLSMGSLLKESMTEMAERALSDSQSVNMEWRAEREGGNSFAKYAGAAVFAPMIFTLPFPTMVYTQPDQEMIMQVNGGNYVKNILSFFVILSVITLLLHGEWKKHLMPLAFTCGYLLSLVVSEFAQSGRFHMPIMPFEMMFAAYGLQLMNRRNIRWFDWALWAEFAICVGWSWFKLAGRGLA